MKLNTFLIIAWTEKFSSFKIEEEKKLHTKNNKLMK